MMSTKTAQSPNLLHVTFDHQSDYNSHSDTKSRFERERHSSALATGYNSLSPLKHQKPSSYDHDASAAGAFPSDLDIQSFKQHLNSNGINLCTEEIRSHNRNCVFGCQLNHTKFREMIERNFFKAGTELQEDTAFTKGAFDGHWNTLAGSHRLTK